MATLFTFSLEKLAKAMSGKASLQDTNQLFTDWPQLFPAPAPQEQQLDRSEFAVYLTAVARDSRALHGPNWSRPVALGNVRTDFLNNTAPLGAAATSRRVLGAVAAKAPRKRAARRPAGKKRGKREK